MKKNQYAFTLTELIIAIFISSIILVLVFGFVSDTMRSLSYAIKNTEVIPVYDQFAIQMELYKKQYDTNTLLIDNAKGTGNDVLLVQKSDNSEGVILGIVNTTTQRLEDTPDYPYISDKVLGFRSVNAAEILALQGDPTLVYGYNFFDDKLYNIMKMRDFQVNLYNTGSLIDMILYVNLNYKTSLNGENFINVGDEFIQKINFNF